MTSTQYTHFFLFDLDDTLYARSDPFLRAFREKISDRGDYDPDALYRSFLARGHDLFEDAMNGRIPMNDMYIYRICSAAASQGIEVTAEEALAFQENYTWQMNHLQLAGPIREMLDTLSRLPVFLGIVTNGPSARQRMKYHNLGLHRWIPEDHLLASGDIGVSKPDPEIFARASDKWHLDAEKTIYVGDNYVHDIQCSAAAGWHSVWYDQLRVSCRPDFTKPPLTLAIVYSDQDLRDVVISSAVSQEESVSGKASSSARP